MSGNDALPLTLRRMFLRIQDLILAQVDDKYGKIVSGGRVPAGVISGTSPATGIGVLTTRGDLLTFDGTNIRIPLGFEGQVLAVSGGLPRWVNPATPLLSLGLLDDSAVALVDSAAADLAAD